MFFSLYDETLNFIIMIIQHCLHGLCCLGVEISRIATKSNKETCTPRVDLDHQEQRVCQYGHLGLDVNKKKTRRFLGTPISVEIRI